MLYDKLKDYTQSGVYPFHMPGHKRQLSDAQIPYDLDITEISGFDNLHHPQGCIREIEKTAASLFHVKRAFMLINGATGGILAAVRSMTKPGDTVIMARNCHQSVYHAAELCRLNAVCFEPQRLSCCPSVYASVTDNDVEQALNAHPEATLVVVTSPTYEGVESDLAVIAELCYHHGARLLVDEAHGAHRYFDRKAVTAMAAGADAAVVSLHKTLPSLTQTALLLTNDASLEDVMQENLAVFETSSPSYVLMSSVEQCLRFVTDRADAFDDYAQRLKLFYKRTKDMQHLSLLFPHISGEAYAYDAAKLVILTDGTDLSGYRLAEILRKKYLLETEMAAGGYVIAMTGVCDTDEGFSRLETALHELDNACAKGRPRESIQPIALPPKAYPAYACSQHASYRTEWNHAVGKVSHEDIFAYPPGIPLVVKGEVVTADIFNAIAQLERVGANILSSRGTYPQGLIVSDL